MDKPGELYHFPNMYLTRISKTVGDWVIFYESRTGGGRGYYAVQKVLKIAEDPADQSHSFAVLDRKSLLTFEENVGRLDPGGAPFETGLPLSGGSNASAVRMLSDHDFSRIVDAGLTTAAVPDALPRTGELDIPKWSEMPGLAEDATPFLGVERDRVLMSRAWRDASFARQVKKAYQSRCAMSGLALRNGGGRPEVEAAHIIPVEADGPDVVWNGLALSGTIHWMFDRGLLAVDRDHTILVAKDSLADDVVTRLLTQDRKLLLPKEKTAHPAQACLDWHRANCFKG